MTRVAPSPAPAAAPRRYGSASGLRDTPWEAAPETDSAAPTRTARTTRGSRSSSSTASPVCPSPPGRGSTPIASRARFSRVTTTAPGGSGNAPMPMPVSTNATRATKAPPSTSAGRFDRVVGGTAGGCPGRAASLVPVMTGVCSALEGVGHRLGEVGDPRAPPGGDVVAGLEHAAVLDRGNGVERGPLRQGLCRLVAADRVGQHDQIRCRTDDELRRQLRIATGGVGRLVGDVLQAEQLVDAADEGGA